jgi:predicted nucleotidyltransferase
MSSRISPSRIGSADPLAQILASSALAHLILYFILYPDAAPHFRLLQRVTGISSRSLQHELARLEQVRMIRREREGRLVRLHVTNHPRWTVFRDMVREFALPEEVLRVAVANVPGIQAAFIFGSCARGDMHAESDIDVFALGDTLRDREIRVELARGTLEASMLLNREVNVARYTPDRLRAQRDGGFLSAVLAGPKRWLVGDETVLQPGTGM